MDSKELNEISAVLNSSSMLVIGFLVSGFLSILTRIILARFLDPSGYGLISEGLAVLSILTVLSLLGTDIGISRFISRDVESRNLVETTITFVLPLSLIITIISFNSVALITSFFDQPMLSPVLKALILNVPASALLGILMGGFRGKEETVPKLIISMVILPGLILLFSVSLVILYEKAQMAAYGYTLAGWTSLLISGLWYFAKFDLNKPRLDYLLPLIKFSIPLGIRSLLGFGIKWSNIILIGYFLSSSSTGLFNSAYPISYGILVFLTSTNYLIMPIISRMESNSNFNSISYIYSYLTRFLVLLTIPLAIVMVLKSKHIISFLFGSSYESAAIILSILTLGQFIKVIFGPVPEILVGVGDTGKEAFAILCSLVVLITLSIPLIYFHSLVGAAVSFLVASLVGGSVRLYYCRKYENFNPLKFISWKIIPPSFIFIIILIPRSNLILTLLQIVFGTIMYLILILVSDVIKKRDIRVLKNFLIKSPLPKKYWIYPLEKIKYLVVS